MAQEQKWSESSVAVKKCLCPHGDQDRKYGKGRRLHNRTQQKAEKGERGWRCTVCGNVKN